MADMMNIIIERCHWSSRVWFITLEGTKQSHKIYTEQSVIVNELQITPDELRILITGGCIYRNVTEEFYAELCRRT
jgi:hypothetical protein